MSGLGCGCGLVGSDVSEKAARQSGDGCNGVVAPIQAMAVQVARVLVVGTTFVSVLALLAAGTVVGQELVRPETDAGKGVADIWPEHAISDEEAARQGRFVMPYTQEQIKMLGALLRQTQRATQSGAGAAPEGRVRRVALAGPASGDIPAVVVRRGYTTVLSFTDMTGAPWPIEEVLVDREFLPEAEDERSSESAHLLYLSPRRRFLEGNAVIKLAGLVEPVVVVLHGGEAVSDFRVDIRIAMAGPNADLGMLVPPRGFHAGDPVLLGLLGGTWPVDAEALAIAGGSATDRAWRFGEDLLLVTRAYLLSPGPWAAERGPSGRWAYRLPDTPHALVSLGGHEWRIGFSRRDLTTIVDKKGLYETK